MNAAGAKPGRKAWAAGSCVLFALLLLVLWRFFTDGAGREGVVRIGYVGSPFLADLYVSAETGAFEGRGLKVSMKRFGSTSDVGYALLSGRIDAGFVEPSRALHLVKGREREGVRVAGSVTFPFGVALVVRKDRDMRLDDLPGSKVAASAENCVLLHRFREDAKRLGVAVGKIEFVFMGFDAMLPALEAGRVDAVLVKGAHALLAEREGHKTLYQNWRAESGDECCPTYLAQVEYFMLVKGLGRDAVVALIEAMEESSRKAPPGEGRRAIGKYTGFPEELLRRFPMPSFSRVGEETEKELGDLAWRRGR